jgi:integrase
VLREHGSPEEVIVRDTDLKGFVVRLRASGRHTYGVNYGRGRFLTLGGSDRLTAGKARKAARDALAQTSLEGAPAMARRKKNALTLKAYLDESYEPWAKSHLKTADETLARLRVTFKDFLTSRLSDLTPFTIERWRTARLSRDGVSRATINRDLVCLRAAIGKAVSWGHLKTHPLAGVKPYRVDSKKIVRFLSEAEEKRLRDALTHRDDARRRERESANQWRGDRGYDEWPPLGTYTDHLTPLTLLALNTGLRRGELFHLRWGDVALDRAVLTVQGASAKSGETRHLPLNSEAVSVLKTWKGDATPDSGLLVFPSADDREQPLEDIKTAWLALVRKAKIADFRFHDCRHHFASRLVQAGVDLNTVRELLGHADIKMVLRYAHLAPETKAAAVARLVIQP